MIFSLLLLLTLFWGLLIRTASMRSRQSMYMSKNWKMLTLVNPILPKWGFPGCLLDRSVNGVHRNPKLKNECLICVRPLFFVGLKGAVKFKLVVDFHWILVLCHITLPKNHIATKHFNLQLYNFAFLHTNMQLHSEISTSNTIMQHFKCSAILKVFVLPKCPITEVKLRDFDQFYSQHSEENEKRD